MALLPRRSFTCSICNRTLDRAYRDTASHTTIGDMCKRCVINATYPKGFTSRHKIRYAQIKASAASRKLGFDISQTEYMKKAAIPCKYCGCGNDTLGLDRIDSSKGYSQENTVSCCKRCNQAKNDMSVSEFLDWIRKVYNFNENRLQNLTKTTP